MQHVKVRDVSSFIKAVSRINEKTPGKSDYLPQELLFRGQSSESYELIPALGRYHEGYADLCHVERNMIETAKRKMPEVFKNDLAPLELLGLLQHYGIPTRLLDLTENALVALFFACSGSTDKNGEVFIFQSKALDVTTYPVENAIADSYRFSRGSFYSLNLFYHDVIQQPYFLEQRPILDFKDDKEGGAWIEECCKQVLFVYSSYHLSRQRIQRGRYILFPNEIANATSKDNGCFLSRIKPMTKKDKSILGIITIPSEVKQKILKEMKILGIDRETLFSDSIDVSCEEIKNKFFV